MHGAVVAVGMLASLCVILYSMMILECWRRCCSVGRSLEPQGRHARG